MIVWLFIIFIFQATAYTPASLPIRVSKHSTWFGFTLKNRQKISHMIPQNTEIAPIKILKNNKAEPKLLFNIYEAQSQFFYGKRFEVVTVVRQKKNKKKLHFVVLDCFTNTLSWDPKSGIQLPNVLRSKLSVKKNKKLNINWKNKGSDTFLEAKAKITGKKQITKEFAVDSNLFCLFQDSQKGVKLDFEENEVMQDVGLLTNLDLQTNIWADFRGHMTHSFIHLEKMDFLADMISFDEYLNF